MGKKNFVLDTNVILHDYRCLENFQENDIYLPIAVLEELDRFKKGSDQINFNAREFIRELDSITSNDLFTTGVSLGTDLGALHIVTGDKYQKRVADTFSEYNADHRILSCALTITERNPEVKTILVTKDVNLRIKARSLGILVEDYTTDKVINTDIFEESQKVYTGIDSEVINKIYVEKKGVDVELLGLDKQFVANECFILKSDRNSALVRFIAYANKVKRLECTDGFGVLPHNAEQSFAFDVLNDPKIKLVALTGKAGTGKTLLALSAALKQASLYKQILLARPIVALANKDLGFLPGDDKQKIAPYMQPLFDNLNIIKGQIAGKNSEVHFLEKLQKEERLIIEALAFIRGRSLAETFCIVDEAQNLTPHEIKTIITRASKGTKMVFTGDVQQIDSPYLDGESNGLAYMIGKMKGQTLFAHVNLIKGERSELSELASNLL